jgi:hypothetical protein
VQLCKTIANPSPNLKRKNMTGLKGKSTGCP